MENVLTALIFVCVIVNSLQIMAIAYNGDKLGDVILMGKESPIPIKVVSQRFRMAGLDIASAKMEVRETKRGARKEIM